MPTVENKNMAPNISDIGLRPLVMNMNTIIPMEATIMTAGNIFIKMLAGTARGTSGGGSRCTSPPGSLGAGSLGNRRNCRVLSGSFLSPTTNSRYRHTRDIAAEGGLRQPRVSEGH